MENQRGQGSPWKERLTNSPVGAPWPALLRLDPGATTQVGDDYPRGRGGTGDRQREECAAQLFPGGEVGVLALDPRATPKALRAETSLL